MVRSGKVGTTFDIVTVGTSAGGLRALQTLLADLPGDLAVPVVIVQHLDPRHRSLMSDILARHTPLEVRQAETGMEIEAGVVYTPAPDHHLLIEPRGVVTLTQTELIRFVRPSIDLLFASAAGAYGDRVIAVVLTGTGSDGANGVETVKEVGGTVIVEDADTAEFGAMPAAAIGTGCADFVLPLEEIGPAIRDLVQPGEEPS